MTKRSQHFFWLALLGHLLLFLSFSLVFTFEPNIYQAKSEETPGSIVQAYVAPAENTPSSAQTENASAKTLPTSSNGIEKPQATQAENSLSAKPAQKAAHMQKPRMKMDEKNFNALLKLLHDATDAQLNYPQLAGDFRVTGTAKIGFMIHPNGQVTQVKLIQTSRFPPFDQAALDAINAISPVRGVNAYLTAPEYIEVNVIFR